MTKKSGNPKFQLIFSDRIGIVFDIAGMVTRKGLNIVTMEVEQSQGMACVCIEIEEGSQAFCLKEVTAMFRELSGISEVREIRALPQERREERFRFLIDGVSDGIISVDGVGVISTINSVACRILGFVAADVLGQNIRDVITSDNVLLECLTKKLPVRRRKSAITSRGRVEFFASAQPVTDPGGKFVGAVVIMKDLKEVKEMAEAVKTPIQITFDDIVGESPSMENLKSFAVKIARSESIVSIRGLSGTGKELLAQAIHFESGRPGPFVPVNCAAMPESLLESELFGYAPGAFTGARKSGKPGLFEVADRGTIFLDEIGDMPPGPQAKILRVLQEGMLRRIGGSREVPFNARIITATHRNLEQMVTEKKFREDLYYRINVLPIHIPPLKERQGDIPLLVDRFLFNINARLGQGKQFLSREAMEKMINHTWPGNVRELKNVIERAAILADSPEIPREAILLSHETAGIQDRFRQERSRTFSGTSLKEQVASFETEIVKTALAENRSVRKAARALGISHTALLNKMKKYSISAGIRIDA